VRRHSHEISLPFFFVRETDLLRMSRLAGFALEQLGRPLNEAREFYKLAARTYEQAIEQLSRSGKEGTRDDVSLHRIGETVLFRLCAVDNQIS